MNYEALQTRREAKKSYAVDEGTFGDGLGRVEVGERASTGAFEVKHRRPVFLVEGDLQSWKRKRDRRE